ncbi:MAG: MBL fold metallo-hydrolase [Clostridia bacterium]|nr:MBL fold metallo-hydrolase [Clostridia bacterium]
MPRKKQKKNQILYFIVAIIILILSALGFEFTANNEKVNIEKLNRITVKTASKITTEFIGSSSQNLQVYYFDVGQADSILVTNQEKTMLIDAGNNADGDLLVQNLKKLKIHKIDYLIGTHPHEDHIGGLDDIIQNFEIGTIYMPKVQTNTKTFEDVLDAVSDKNLKIRTPKVGDSFKIGEAQCKIVSVSENKTNFNLSSIIIQMEFDGVSYLFTGDAEKEIEENLTIGKINILKVAHHGSNTSSNNEFIQKIAPQIAIISVGKQNSYGHPDKEVLERLEKIGSKIYRTDEVGNIMIEQSKQVI